MKKPVFPYSTLVSSYRAIPFAIELQYLIEWYCTPTVLSLYDFIRVEELHALMYQGRVFITKEKEEQEAMALGWVIVTVEYFDGDASERATAPYCTVPDPGDGNDAEASLPSALTMQCQRGVSMVAVEKLIKETILAASNGQINGAVDHLTVRTAQGRFSALSVSL
jgi:hypothetical protein